jgi:hypothetical protein
MDNRSQRFRQNAEECRRLARTSSATKDLLAAADEWEQMAKLSDNLLVMDALTISIQERQKREMPPRAKGA